MWYTIDLETKEVSPLQRGFPEGSDLTHAVVKQEHLTTGWYVSTVFMGLDHGYDGLLHVFETMVFPEGSWEEVDCDRYPTWGEAEKGHKILVEKYKKVQNTGEDT